MTKRRETSQTASCPSAEGKESLWDLWLKVAAMTAEKKEWYDRVTEATKKLNVAEAGVSLQSTLRNAAPGELDTHTTEIAKLQKQLTANSTELSQLSAKNS